MSHITKHKAYTLWDSGTHVRHNLASFGQSKSNRLHSCPSIADPPVIGIDIRAPSFLMEPNLYGHGIQVQTIQAFRTIWCFHTN